MHPTRWIKKSKTTWRHIGVKCIKSIHRKRRATVSKTQAFTNAKYECAVLCCIGWKSISHTLSAVIYFCCAVLCVCEIGWVDLVQSLLLLLLLLFSLMRQTRKFTVLCCANLQRCLFLTHPTEWPECLRHKSILLNDLDGLHAVKHQWIGTIKILGSRLLKADNDTSVCFQKKS